MKLHSFLAGTSILVLSSPPAAFACSVCFGNPDSPATQAIKAGILVLFAVTVAVLGSIAGITVVWSRRAKKLQSAARDSESSLNA